MNRRQWLGASVAQAIAGGLATVAPASTARAEAALSVPSNGREYARVPLASLRARQQVPDVHKALYEPVFAQYQPRFGPNKFDEYLPTSLKDAKDYLDREDGWR
jgi:hypothetical protein